MEYLYGLNRMLNITTLLTAHMNLLHFPFVKCNPRPQKPFQNDNIRKLSTAQSKQKCFQLTQKHTKQVNKI